MKKINVIISLFLVILAVKTVSAQERCINIMLVAKDTSYTKNTVGVLVSTSPKDSLKQILPLVSAEWLMNTTADDHNNYLLISFRPDSLLVKALDHFTDYDKEVEAEKFSYVATMFRNNVAVWHTGEVLQNLADGMNYIRFAMVGKYKDGEYVVIICTPKTTLDPVKALFFQSKKDYNRLFLVPDANEFIMGKKK